MCDLSSLMRDQPCAPCTGSIVLTIGHPSPFSSKMVTVSNHLSQNMIEQMNHEKRNKPSSLQYRPAN